MKTLFIAITALLSLSAFAKDTTLTGKDARRMMETLAGAGFDVDGVGEEWGTLTKPLSVNTGPFYCHFTAFYPDGWMVNATCTFGKAGDSPGKQMSNPLALAQAIEPYAAFDSGLGNRWMAINNIRCTLDYKTTVYACVVSADPNQD